MSIISIYFAAYFSIALNIPEKYAHAIIYINPIMQLSNFILGMLLCKLYLWIKNSNHRIYCSRTGITALQVVSVSLVVAMCYYYELIPARFSLSSYWWIAVSLVVVVYSVGDTIKTPVNRLLHIKPMLWIGDMSFIFYLTHYVAINLWQMYFHSDRSATVFIQSVILISILLCVSCIINKAIIIPITGALKGVLSVRR